MPSRRSVLAALGGALSLPALSRASAQSDFPNRPLRIVVPFPPGGSQDVLARVIGERLSAALGQPVVIENRPGAAGNVGVDVVARAESDGYTIGVATIGPMSAHTALYARLPFNPRTDFTYLADLFEIPNVFVVNLASPVNSVQEFIAWAKQRGSAKVSYGTPGIGTTAHLGTELFSRKTGLELLHVPYRTGAVAVQDLIAGRIDMMFDNLPTIIGQVEGKQIRSLAVSTGRRWPGLPEVPTMIESGIADFDVTSWSGMIAPKSLPAPIAARLTAELVKMGEDPSFVAKLQQMGASSTMKGPDILRARVEKETPRWAEVIKAAGLRVD